MSAMVIAVILVGLAVCVGLASSYRRLGTEPKRPHVDSGYRCLVAHYTVKDGTRIPLPQCIRCARCWKWITPDKMGDGCKNGLGGV